MSVLYFALAIYIVGVAVILYVRPSTMFHPDNGTWKEFGLDNSTRSTVFPFWMFTIVWAFMSYAIATIGNVFIANVVLRSAPGDFEDTSSVAIPISEAQYHEPAAPRVRAPRAPRMPKLLPAPAPAAAPIPSPMELPNMAPAPAPAPMPTPEPVKLPGYYFVEPQASGIPRFVYFGHEPPSFENLIAHS